MNLALWIVQGILAVMFAMAGTTKATKPKEKLSDHLSWTEDFSTGTVKLIAVAELLGAIGLIVPAVTDIAPILTPIAASALAVLMLGAVGTHIRRKEPDGVVLTAVLLLANVFVAWGRFGPEPF